MSPESGSTATVPAEAGKLLHAHLAEYQALTSRLTNRLTMQFALWPILLIALTLVGNMRGLFGLHGMMWLAATIVQVVLLEYDGLMLGIYTDVQYIETELGPRVRTIVGNAPFWCYERFVRDHRPVRPMAWEYAPLALALLAPGFAAYIAFPLELQDYIGLAVNGSLLFFQVRMVRKAVQLRGEMLG